MDKRDDDLASVTDNGPRMPEGFNGHPINHNPEDVARWERGDLLAAISDLISVIDYMRVGDGSLPPGGLAKIRRAKEALAEGAH